MDGAGGLIEVSKSMDLSASQPSVIQDVSASLEGGSAQILGISNVRIDFNSTVPLSAGCIIQIAVPDDFSNLRLSLTAVKAYGMFGFIRSLPFSVSDQFVQINGACPTFTDNSSPAPIRLEGLQNPPIVKATQTFKVVVTDSQGGTIVMTTSSFGIPADSFKPGAFSQAKLLLVNPMVQEASGLSVSLLPDHKLSQDGRVIFTLPTEFGLQPASPVLASSVKSLNTTFIECLANTTTNRVLVRNLFYSFGYSPKVDGQLNFNLTSIIARNPSLTLPGASIKVQTYDLVQAATKTSNAVYGLVDEISIGTEGLLSPGQFKSLNFTVDANTNNAFPANATITFTLSHTIDAGMQAYIQLPADFGVAQLVSKCTNAVGFSTVNPNCTVTYRLDGSTLVTVDSLKSLPAGSVVSVKLTQIRMPRYQGKLSGQITVSTGTQESAQLVDQSKSDFFTQNALTFDAIEVKQASQVCSDLTSLNLTISKPAIQVLQSDSFVFKLPQTFAFEQAALQCRAQGKLITCLLDSTKRIVTIGNLTDQPVYSFQIDGLRNAPSTRPPTSVDLALMDQQQRLLIGLSASKANAFIQATQPASLHSLKLVQSSTQPGLTTDFSFQLSLANYTQPIFAAIELPTCMAFQQGQIVLSQSLAQLKSSYNTTQRLTVEMQPNQTRTGFIVKGLQNPSDTCLDNAGIKVNLYEDSSLLYLMATGTVQPSLSCIGLCTSCLAKQKDFCTTCSTGYALVAETGTCSEVCPSGSIFNSENNQCDKCIASCSSCFGKTDFCTGCVDPTFVTREGACISKVQCESTPSHFVNTLTKTCDSCQEPCMACSMDGCLACSGEFYLHSSSCVNSCPVGSLAKALDQGNLCLSEPPKIIIWGLFADAPLAYLVVCLSLIAAMVKLTCMRDMSLLVTLVILSNLIEQASLLKLVVNSMARRQVEGLDAVEKGFLNFSPLCAMGAFILLNIYVVAAHCRCLKSGTADVDKQNEGAEYDRWVHSRLAKRTLIYTVGCLCSFHNLNWFNFNGMFPDSLKRRIVASKFVKYYTTVSQVSMAFPRLPLVAYAVYFGVFNARGRMQVESEEQAIFVACCVEHCTLMMTSIFLLFLALNFAWLDDPAEAIKLHEIKNATHNRGVDDEEEPQLYVPKSSIELHMLRSSRAAKLKSSAFLKRYYESSQMPMSNSLEVSTIVEGHPRDQTDSIVITGADLLKPPPIADPAFDNKREIIAERQESNASNEINFDFLEQMKHSIIKSKRDRPGKPLNASDGKQALKKSYNSSERTIKSQRFKLKNLTTFNPRKGGKQSLQAVEEGGYTVQTVESIEHHASEIADKITSIKKPSGTSLQSSLTAKTKVESFIKDFDSQIYEQRSRLGRDGSFESPLSVNVSQPPSNMKSRFAKQSSD